MKKALWRREAPISENFPEDPDPEKPMGGPRPKPRPKDDADDQTTPEFLAIARITRPQGRRGEVAAEILTDFPARFQTLDEVFLRSGLEPPQTRRLEKAWPHKGRIILKFQGVDAIDEAERLRDYQVVIRREERVPAPPNHYYLYELVGCKVKEQRPEGLLELGSVEGLEATGGVDLLKVKTAEGELLIPFAEAICKKVDLTARVIEVELPEDLADINKSKK